MGEGNMEMLQDTLRIMEQGFYELDGRRVWLKLTRSEMESAQVILPDEVKDICGRKERPGNYVIGRCSYSCENTDSFSAAREIYRDSPKMFKGRGRKNILVLNFANPVHPGGGVRMGARAQEEDLCRKSSLLLSLEGGKAKAYYEYNRGLDTHMGSDAMIFTPRVEIIKDERGRLLEETAEVAVLTCAAPMIGRGMEGMSGEQYRQMVYNRIMGMLKCAAYFGYYCLVLGAWGCGAFGNDAAQVSDLFFRALKDMEFNGLREKDVFRKICFAVFDRTPGQYNYREFSRNFASGQFYREEDQEEILAVKRRIRKREEKLDQIRGCLIGGAAGDALGYVVEFWDEDEIFSEFGPGGIRQYRLDPACGKALISDDTQMTLFTANGLLVGETMEMMDGHDRDPRHYVAMAYQDWLLTQEISYQKSREMSHRYRKKCISWLSDVPELYSRRAPGNTCLSALVKQKRDGGYADDYIGYPQNNSKGCGGIMRVAPVALWGGGYAELWDLYQDAVRITALTHGNSLGYMPAAVAAHIINRIVFPKKQQSLKEIVIEARDRAAEIFREDKRLGKLLEIMDLAVRLSENGGSDPDNIHQIGEGWVGEETLGIALYCALKYQDDFSAGIIAAVNHKGDSDSTGAVTGNILGALAGYGAIEEKWKENLELSDVILELAGDLCRGCQVSGPNGSYRDPDWERKYRKGQWKG